MDFVDYYQVLEVDKDAADADIRRRYLELAKQHHPDVGGSDEHMKLLNEAFAHLQGDARKEYDKQYALHSATDDIWNDDADIAEYVQRTQSVQQSRQRNPVGFVVKLAFMVAVVMVSVFFTASLAGALKQNNQASPATTASTVDTGTAPTPLTGISVPGDTSSTAGSSSAAAVTNQPAQTHQRSVSPSSSQPSATTQNSSQNSSSSTATTTPALTSSTTPPSNDYDLPGASCRQIQQSHPYQHIACPVTATN